MTFRNFKAATNQRDRLSASVDEASAKIRAFDDQRGPMGLLPDSVRLSDEYQSAQAEYGHSFARLRGFNRQYVKIFKKDIQEARRKKYAA